MTKAMWYLRIVYHFPEPSEDFVGPFASKAAALKHKTVWAGSNFDVVQLGAPPPACTSPTEHINYLSGRR